MRRVLWIFAVAVLIRCSAVFAASRWYWLVVFWAGASESCRLMFQDGNINFLTAWHGEATGLRWHIFRPLEPLRTILPGLWGFGCSSTTEGSGSQRPSGSACSLSPCPS